MKFRIKITLFVILNVKTKNQHCYKWKWRGFVRLSKPAANAILLDIIFSTKLQNYHVFIGRSMLLLLLMQIIDYRRVDVIYIGICYVVHVAK